ncbi:ORFL136C.iORF1 [Human betaherpesvirus 5]|nr:ORFL136C.iORF1 [Human betaherpesvirus 5]QHX40461.1 ORFL136C.iORF1 [Human betaherpesvirus 5]
MTTERRKTTCRMTWILRCRRDRW